MELKDFIKGTVRDICEAVNELNEELNDKGLYVNPPIDGYKEGAVYDCGGRLLHEIDFNVSVVSSEKSETDGKLKVYIANAGLSSHQSNENTNSLKFKLLVALPSIS